MSYETEIAKTQVPALPELYEFLTGGIYQRYTSFHETISFEGRDYTPSPIKRGNIEFTTELKHAEVSITAPVSSLFISYVANQPIEPVTVRIIRAVYGDEDAQFVTVFKGRVKGVSVENLTATARCRSGNSILEARIPGITYQSYCNHDMYDGVCKLNSLDWRVEATVDAISGSELDFNEISGYDANYFTGGYVVSGDDSRLITAYSGITLSLHIPFDSRVIVGSECEIYPSCRQDPELCLDTYDNIENYLGMPYIQSKNPVYWGFK